MDPPEEQQAVGGLRMQRECIGVDPVVDRRCIVQRRVAIGLADGDIGRRRVVALVDGHDRR